MPIEVKIISILLFFASSYPLLGITGECVDKLNQDTHLKKMVFEFQKPNEDREQFIKDFYASGEKYPPFKKIKHVLDSGKAKILFIEKHKNDRCINGVLAFFEAPNEISICMDPERTMGRILDITIHEVLHFYQHELLDLDDLFIFDFKGETGLLTNALKYTFDKKKHLNLKQISDFHKETIRLFRIEDKKRFEKIIDDLDELSKYFYISEKLLFEIKRPSFIIEKVALDLVPEKINKMKHSVSSDLSALLKDIPIEFHSRIYTLIKNRYVVSRLLAPVQVYCIEVQANILSAALNYLRYDKVKHIPECLKLFPNVKPGPIKNFEEFNHLMTEAGREYVSRLDKYGKEFNPNFGHKGFEKIFSIEGCGKGFIP